MDKQSDIEEWWLMIEFELDIPSLTKDGIQMNELSTSYGINHHSFEKVKVLISWSMIDWIDNDWDADSLDQFIRQKSECLLKNESNKLENSSYILF